MRTILATGFCVLLATFVGLGFWQLDRAEQKRQLFGAFEAGGTDDAAASLIEGDALAEHRYRRLRLHGRFLASRQILLDWMTHAGQVGYQVLTPFRPDDSEHWIVVNRGWVAAAPDRSALPDIEVAEDERTILGQIDALPQPGLRLDTPDESRAASWPRALLYPTFDELEETLELPLVDYQLLLGADEADGFVRAWQPRSIPPERHLGYAVQWFGLGVALIGIAVAVTIKSMRRKKHASGSE